MRNREVPLGQIVEAIGGEASFDPSGLKVLALTADSRAVKRGDLFFALIGETVDGHFYVPQALERGAVAVVVERGLDPDARIICVPDTKIALAEAAREFYGNPQDKLDIVGITGTNGKSTTTYMIQRIAEVCGKSFGTIGTLGYSYGDKACSLAFTTPDSIKLFEIIAEMAEAGTDGLAMEVSSHGIVQQRCHGLVFSVVGFTNLTQDHLDYHRDMNSYFEIKSRIFEGAEPNSASVINIDDRYGEKLAAITRSKRISTYAINSPADLRASEIECSADRTKFLLTSPFGQAVVSMGIPGFFNIYNALCAAGVGLSMGWPLEGIARGLEDFKGIAGRLQRVEGEQSFSIYVDYSHTPDALERAIESCRYIAKKRGITVFGAGGDRDRDKRPKMGRVAGSLSDIVILTSDNPRSEKPEDILDQIERGVPPSAEKYRISDRREAIRFALSSAEEGDVVLIAGKGHEDYQIIGKTKRHFNDREVAEQWLVEFGYRSGIEG